MIHALPCMISAFDSVRALTEVIIKYQAKQKGYRQLLVAPEFLVGRARFELATNGLKDVFVVLNINKINNLN